MQSNTDIQNINLIIIAYYNNSYSYMRYNMMMTQLKKKFIQMTTFFNCLFSLSNLGMEAIPSIAGVEFEKNRDILIAF